MSKNTIKIKNFVNDQAQTFVIKQKQKKYSSKFVVKINELFKSIKTVKLFSRAPVKLKKINNSGFPLLYIILCEINFPDQKINDYQYFLSWYRKNCTFINLRKIISSNTKYYDKLFSPSDHRKHLHEMLYENTFIFLDVSYYAESSDLILEEYTNNNTDIYLYVKENDKRSSLLGKRSSLLGKRSNLSEEGPDIELTMKIIELFRKLSNNNAKVKLVILWCDQKRLLPENDKFISPENINAGCTISGQYIYIWRKEEFYKVLIHELIHYFVLDFWDMDNSEIDSRMRKMINIKGTDAVNEAYTEIMAVIINSVIYSQMNPISFDDIINYEIIFTHFQIAKIIDLFGGNTYHDLFKIEIIQSTSLVSYIIIKGILINNSQIILDHFDSYFDYDKAERFKNYNNIHKSLINKKSEKMLNAELINHFLKLIKNLSKNYVTRSLKMILFEI